MSDKVLRCVAGGRSFAIDVALVQGIDRPRRWARLPGAPPFVSGVIEMRDQVVAVIDLATRMGLCEQARPPDCPVVLIESEELVALAVDWVAGVTPLDPDSLRVPAGALGAGIQGVGPEGLVVLETEAIVDGRPLRPLSQVSTTADEYPAQGGGASG